MKEHKFANLCIAWIIFCLVVALGMKIAKGTPLEEFLVGHNLEFPQIVKEQMIKQNLVAGAGIMNEKEQIFTVFFLPKPETFDIQEFDPRKAVMQVAFYLVKKKITVEYTAYKECSHAGKCWQGGQKKVFIFLTLFPL